MDGMQTCFFIYICGSNNLAQAMEGRGGAEIANVHFLMQIFRGEEQSSLFASNI